MLDTKYSKEIMKLSNKIRNNLQENGLFMKQFVWLSLSTLVYASILVRKTTIPSPPGHRNFTVSNKYNVK